MRFVALLMLSFITIVVTAIVSASAYLGCPISWLREWLFSLVIVIGLTFSWLIWVPYIRALERKRYRRLCRQRKRETDLAPLDYLGGGPQEYDPEFTPDLFPTEDEPPMAEVIEDPTTQPTAVQVYLDAHAQLWKLERDGEDDTDYAEYLRQSMREQWAVMNYHEREQAEIQSADAWKQL